MSAWYGIYMPTATPKAVQERVQAEVARLVDAQDTRARLDTIGAELSPMTQPQFVAFHEAENKRYAELIKKRGIKLD
jgi:tripartite-type tricarboxylate transporter receptor subunit TctC